MRVLVFGTFDEFHPGHEFVLREATKRAGSDGRGELHVVVARDANVERIKKRRPVQSETDRARAIERAFPGTRVVLGDPEDFLAPVRAIQPDLILLGYDQKLPPGVREADLPGTVERLPAFRPEKFKSSLRRSGS
jgi:FAD synthetase